MKIDHVVPPGHVALPIRNAARIPNRKLAICGLSSLIFLLVGAFVVQGQNAAHDPGPRTGTPGAGGVISGLSGAEGSYFNKGQDEFSQVQNVQSDDAFGLGPTFNSNSCGNCHSQPAIGGSSPAVNPQIEVATDSGAINNIPSFLTLNGPVREVRFKFAVGPNGRISDTPDGGVHALFTVRGRSDAPGCQMTQPDFERMAQEDNLSFRIPTPVFGAGLIESIDETTIIANQAAESAWGRFLGISGYANRSGNDGSITRFGWKAQNKSLMVFAGEAYNVEMGVTNELFPNERGYPNSPIPASCLFNPTPEDTTHFDGTIGTEVLSDVGDFTNFMRLLDQPAPACTGSGCTPSIINGRRLFTNVAKCSICHTPTMRTGKSSVAPLSNVDANLFSDLLVHNMGRGLADGISQGGAGPDEFRTAPLWGVGQRLFFLHDGRTSDLLRAIEMHQSPGSEANTVIRMFNGLSENDKQDILNFLRSL